MWVPAAIFALAISYDLLRMPVKVLLLRAGATQGAIPAGSNQ